MRHSEKQGSLHPEQRIRSPETETKLRRLRLPPYTYQGSGIQKEPKELLDQKSTST